MRRSGLAVALLAIAAPCFAQRGDRGPGLIWEFTAVKGSEVVKGQYRVFRKEVFKGARKVGVIQPISRDETTLEVTGFPLLNGKTHLHRARQESSDWVGTLTKDDGSKWAITIVIKE